MYTLLFLQSRRLDYAWACHDYLLLLAAQARTWWRVIIYDQIGCGLSHINESKPEMWTVDLYCEEIDAVRNALGLERIHLLSNDA